MATLDIFKNNAFRLVSMLEAIENVDYKPQRMGQLGIFTAQPVRNQTVSIEKRDNVLSLIQTSPRGAPLPQRSEGKRNIRDFRTFRIAKADTLQASELADIRAFGSETELMQVQAEIMRRLAGPAGLMSDAELTLENMRLGAIQGIVKDADGSTLYNWYDEWGITVLPAAEVNFDFANADSNIGSLRVKCTKIVRDMQKASKGAWTSGTRVYALCGDNFWDMLTKAKEVRETYLNYTAAAELRDGLAYESFNFGGVTWENYRGTDDGATVTIPSDKVKFFPVNAPGVFLEVWAPGEAFEHLGQPGRPFYPMILPDDKRNHYVDIELYSYPLHICTRPLMLQSGRVG